MNQPVPLAVESVPEIDDDTIPSVEDGSQDESQKVPEGVTPETAGKLTDKAAEAYEKSKESVKNLFSW